MSIKTIPSATGYRVLDCSQLLVDHNSSYLPAGQPLQRCPFNTHERSGFANEVWIYGCDQGTHTDSPSHFIDGALRIHEMNVNGFVSEGFVIDVRAQCEEAEANEKQYVLTVDDVLRFEAQHKVRISPRSIVCMRSGWSTRFSDIKKYRNFDPKTGSMRFPGFSAEAAKFLHEERQVCNLGIDTFSPDVGSSCTWPVHRFILALEGGFLVENMVLEELPPFGFTFVSLPLKIHNSPESPTRVFGVVPPPMDAKDSLCSFRRTVQRVIDVSHILQQDIPTYPGAQQFVPFAKATVAVEGYWKNVYCSGSDLGTHVDSPQHFFADGRSVSDLSPQAELLAPGIIIDVRDKCSSNPDYALTVEDIAAWEATHGKIPEHALVCMRSGWSTKFHNSKEYRNKGEDGKMHFPAFGVDAANFLRKERQIVGLGVDTLSLDVGITDDFPVHQAMLSKAPEDSTHPSASGIFQVENMKLDFTEAEQKEYGVGPGEALLPPKGFTLAVLPFNVKGAQEALCRCVAVVHQ